MNAWNKLGVIAGAGALPLHIAAACRENGAEFHIIRLAGVTDHAAGAFPGDECGIGEAGKILDVLKREQCDVVVFAGLVRRPDFHNLKADMRGAMLLPKIMAAASRGDGHILDVLVKTIEEEGMTVIGVDDAVSSLAAPAGALGDHSPTDANLADIKKAAGLINAMGGYDVGQGVVVANGFVLAVEAAEGTDAMLSRCAGLANNVSSGGVLVKRPKPDQELRIDLPTVGTETIRRAIEARLAGIAVEHKRTLVLDRDEAVAMANDAGLFIYGFSTEEVSS